MKTVCFRFASIRKGNERRDLLQVVQFFLRGFASVPVICSSTQSVKLRLQSPCVYSNPNPGSSSGVEMVNRQNVIIGNPRRTNTMSRIKRIPGAGQLMTISIALLALFIPAVLRAQQTEGKPALASWKDGQAKTTILEFVRQVTDKSGPKYVKPEERIAAFDDD